MPEPKNQPETSSLTKEQLRERLNMKIMTSQLRRMSSSVREDQLDKAKKFVSEQLSKAQVSTKAE